jgi:hypothetical protein
MNAWVKPLGVGALAVVAAGCSEPRGSSLDRRVDPLLVWGGEQKVVASDAVEIDQFGDAVSLTTDHALVGAYGADSYRGAAYVYVKSGNAWTGEQKLVASDGVAGDNFGWSVSLTADGALVGAYEADSYRGAAYVYVKSGGSWTEQKLVAKDGVAGDNFGYAVSLAGDRALVGAYGRDAGRGAAYVYVKNGDSWTEEQELVATDGAANDAFGSSVSLAADRALVGAPGNDSYNGGAYVFVRSSGTAESRWTQEQKLIASDGAEFNQFGSSVSLAADRALVGAYWDDNLTGAVYSFARSGSASENPWTGDQKLLAKEGADGDRFGSSISVAGNRALIGAFGSQSSQGAAYIFTRDESAPQAPWTEDQRLVASDGKVLDLFGWSVALADGQGLVGAYYTDQLRGAAYAYWLGLANGDPCSADLDCASGYCVGNLCCNIDCTGACGACSIAAGATADGTCAIFPAGSDGSPACGALACNGVSPSCGPCGSDADCPDARYCAADRTCKPRAELGQACHELGGQDCLLPGCRVCQSGFCADGVCCDAACDGPCAACTAKVKGAGDDGHCGPIAAGTDPEDECSDSGIATCETNGLCDGAGGCQRYPTSTGCAPAPCTRGDGCTSGHCEDGICCDRTCAANERCLAALKVSGGDGTCGPARSAVLGAPCSFDVQCTSGHCAGGVCSNTTCDGPCEAGTAASAPGGDAGCACRVGESPTHGPRAWLGGALALLLHRRTRRPRRSAVNRLSPSRHRIALALIIAGACFGGCGGRPNVSTSGPGGGPAGGGAGLGSTDGGVGGTGGGNTAPASPLLPARVRRLTNAEYAASVSALLGVDAKPSVAGFPPDATQKLGFTVNDAQIVSSVLAAELDSTAQDMVAAARQNGQFDLLAPCDDPINDGETCASSFVESFGARAYRRPLTDEDIGPLLDLYRAGADVNAGGTYDDGIDFVTRAILQAPSFIYLTELGDSTASSPAGKTTLTPYETASLLSYIATAAPPDKTLRDNIDSLVTADGREQQLRRLLPSLPARMRWVRVVREWLGIDGIAEVDKDSNVYPSFAPNHDAMAAESVSFIDEVLSNGSGTLLELLGAEWTFVDPANGATDDEISSYYTGYYGLGSVGTTGSGERISLSGALGGNRVGILNQGAFLSRFASATGSNPVQRGVAVMRRVACLDLPDPAELDITVIPPVPDPNTPKTTRELYAAHSTDPVCNSCHRIIDNFGFVFEQYDGMGAFRAEEAVKTATGTVLLPVDTATTLAGTGTDLDGDYSDSNALARALSSSATVRACMARQMFRASAGRSDMSVGGAEDNFLGQWRQLPADQQSNLIETLVAFVRSDGFVVRSTGP